MKNTSLALFAALILLGWTSLAAGVIAVFAGQPEFSTQVHQHVVPEAAPKKLAPLYSDVPCEPDSSLDASVPCEA